MDVYISVWDCRANLVASILRGGTQRFAPLDSGNITENELIRAVEEQGGAANISGLYQVPLSLRRRISKRALEAARQEIERDFAEAARQSAERKRQERMREDALRASAIEFLSQHPDALQFAREWDGVYSGYSWTVPGAKEESERSRAELARRFAHLGVKVVPHLSSTMLVVPDELAYIFVHRGEFV